MIRRILFPDSGVVLGDHEISETFISDWRGGRRIVTEQEAAEAVGADQSRVVYTVEVFSGTDDETGSTSLYVSWAGADVPLYCTHVSLRLVDAQGRNTGSVESLEHWSALRMTSASAVCYLELVTSRGGTGIADRESELHINEKLYAWLCNFLLLESPLRTLDLFYGFADSRMLDELLEAFVQPACKVENLKLTVDLTDLDQCRSLIRHAPKLANKCRSLFFKIMSLWPYGAEVNPLWSSFLSELMLPPDRSQLLTLVLDYHYHADVLFHDVNCWTPLTAAVKQQSCKLRRLDIRTSPQSPDLEMRMYTHAADRRIRGQHRTLAESVQRSGGLTLLQSVASPDCCCIQDLGVSLVDDDIRDLLVQAFQSGSSLAKIKALRLSYINSDKAVRSVVDILASPSSNCKVRFLQIDMDILDAPEEYYACFFKELQRVQARIEYLMARIDVRFLDSKPDRTQLMISNLVDFVGWDACPLLGLQYEHESESDIEMQSMEVELANALEGNYLLTALSYPWTSAAAKSRAAAFLARNRLYKSAGLHLKEQQMKPQVARLFLCGHGEVGKTTIRKALLKLHQPGRRAAASTSCIGTTSTTAACCMSSCNQLVDEPRTRGLEMHQLCFTQGEKLVIFDLAGQPDYHAFHHFFVANTSNDLFMVVCKYTDYNSTPYHQLARQLEYWMRFIVSHRNSVHGPNPKVILVLNFFPRPPTSAAGSNRQLEQSEDDMQGTAERTTQLLREKYKKVLDFGDPDAHQYVFGVNARNPDDIKPILKKLQQLLPDLLSHRPMIPKFSHYLLSSILPQLTCNRQMKQIRSKLSFSCGMSRCLVGRKAPEIRVRNIVAYEDVKERCLHQAEGHGNSLHSLERRTQVALIELHNAGEIIFFPPVDFFKQQYTYQPTAKISFHDPTPTTMSNTSSRALIQQGQNTESSSSWCQAEAHIPIITNPSWFCNKVVGELLAPQDPVFQGSSQRSEVDVKEIIRKRTGCPETYLDGMLECMQSLELCYVIKGINHEEGGAEFFFPSVTKNRELVWPAIFPNEHTAAGTASATHFYGRRLRCKETEKYLIPSGVFSRLQVKLLGFCGVASMQSYRVGYHWASFVKDNFGVMVRFGGASTQLSQLPSMLESFDDHPQWIDILICCPSPSSSHALRTTEQNSKENTIMDGIKHEIFEICQATSRGIPTVVLEECILKDRSHEDVISLTDVEEVIRKKGLASHIAWKNQTSSRVVELLLPNEVNSHVTNQFRALKQIETEFASRPSTLKNKAQYVQNNEDGMVKFIDPQLQQMYELMMKQFKLLDEKVEDIRRNVNQLVHDLHQMEVNILSNCSTRLLTQLLAFKDNVPTYPYLTDLAQGKLTQLKSFLVGNKARVRILCESTTDGPHEVDGPPGKVVIVKKGVLMNVAPYLVPALRVMCCAARLAMDVYLPGASSSLISLLQCLEPLGIDTCTQKDLVSKISSKALDVLFDGIDAQIQQLHNPSAVLDEQQAKDAVTALQELLGQSNDLDMEKDFGLFYCTSIAIAGDNHAKPLWLCDKHAIEGYRKLQHQHGNPFS